jgi:uncharacterized protein YegP (UPF0339 family)
MPFVIRRTDAGFHSVITGRNGEDVWTTEVYEDKRDAEHAFELLGTPDQMTGPNRPEYSYEDQREDADPVIVEQDGPPEEPVVPVDEMEPLPLPDDYDMNNE